MTRRIERSTLVSSFVDACETAIIPLVAERPAPRTLTECVFDIVRSSTGATVAPRPESLPACDHLPGTIGTDTDRGSLAAVRASIGELAPLLTWYRRAGLAAAADFADGHANAMVVGPDGLERRDDVMIGLSLIAPGVTYPNHRHPPEEVYLVVSPGAWRQEDGPWLERDAGEIVHNPANIIHSMRAAPHVALLAVWMLWSPEGVRW